MDGDPVDLYLELGIGDHRCTADTVKRAYRQLAKRHHPDIGGNPKAFARIKLAYDVLSDPARRACYDETGEFDDAAAIPDDPNGPVYAAACGVVMEVIDMGGVLDVLVITSARQIVRERQQQARQKAMTLRTLITKIETFVPKITTTGEVNVLAKAIESRLGDMRGHLAALEANIALGDRVWRFLGAYGVVMPPAQQWLSGGFAGPKPAVQSQLQGVIL